MFAVEAYITEDNLTSDKTIGNCARENDGWIRLELLSRCNKLSQYSYDTILHALYVAPSNIIQLSTFDPRCIRRRCPSVTKDSIQDNRANISTDLPYNFSNKQTDQHNFIKGKSFSTRLSNHSSRVSFNTNTSSPNDDPGK